MPAGAPLGNQNAKKGKRFQKAIERVLARKYGDVDAGYEALAEKYLELAEAKDQPILRDFVDRSDGKPVQALEHSGPDGEAIETKNSLSVAFVTPENAGG